MPPPQSAGIPPPGASGRAAPMPSTAPAPAPPETVNPFREGSVAPSASVEPADLPWRTPAPEPTGGADRLFGRGTVLLTLGGVLGGMFVLTRDVAYVVMLVDLRRAADERNQVSDAYLGFGEVAIFGSFVVAPLQFFVALPAGLVGAGAYRRGRYAGWYGEHVRRAGGSLAARRTAGWVLVGAGSALFLTQFAVMQAWFWTDRVDDRTFAMSHIGLSLAATGAMAAGLSMGPYASGVLRGRRERARLSMPMLHPLRGGGALSIGGRF